jgi:hypothetical protein
MGPTRYIVLNISISSPGAGRCEAARKRSARPTRADRCQGRGLHANLSSQFRPNRHRQLKLTAPTGTTAGHGRCAPTPRSIQTTTVSSDPHCPLPRACTLPARPPECPAAQTMRQSAPHACPHPHTVQAAPTHSHPVQPPSGGGALRPPGTHPALLRAPAWRDGLREPRQPRANRPRGRPARGRRHLGEGELRGWPAHERAVARRAGGRGPPMGPPLVEQASRRAAGGGGSGGGATGHAGEGLEEGGSATALALHRIAAWEPLACSRSRSSSSSSRG